MVQHIFNNQRQMAAARATRAAALAVACQPAGRDYETW